MLFCIEIYKKLLVSLFSYHLAIGYKENLFCIPIWNYEIGYCLPSQWHYTKNILSLNWNIYKKSLVSLFNYYLAIGCKENFCIPIWNLLKIGYCLPVLRYYINNIFLHQIIQEIIDLIQLPSWNRIYLIFFCIPIWSLGDALLFCLLALWYFMKNMFTLKYYTRKYYRMEYYIGFQHSRGAKVIDLTKKGLK